jgi:hypothetical protein
MRKTLFIIIICFPLFAIAQIGLKGGLNFANVTGASSINSSSRSGFMFGIFLEPSSSKIISSKTELIYSRQGYDFKNGTTTGNVNLDYLLIPQGMCINITKFVQLQLGAQIAFLLNAKADTTTSSGSSNPYSGIMNYYNKFDYGFAVGAEIHPFMGLLIGARYNISLGKLYKDAQSGQMPSFSSADAKNNVVQIFAGWKFGGYKSKKK